MCGLVHYHDAETTLPATCRAVSSKLHPNLHIEMTINTLSRWYELVVHHTVDVKKCNEHHFFLGFDEV